VFSGSFRLGFGWIVPLDLNQSGDETATSRGRASVLVFRSIQVGRLVIFSPWGSCWSSIFMHGGPVGRGGNVDATPVCAAGIPLACLPRWHYGWDRVDVGFSPLPDWFWQSNHPLGQGLPRSFHWTTPFGFLKQSPDGQCLVTKTACGLLIANAFLKIM
jgi:hypothetical protein